MAAFPGGAGQGVATGRIELDTSDLERAARAARTLGRVFEDALSGVDRAAKKPLTGFAAMSAGINNLRGELLGLAAAAASLSVVGLRSADSFEAAQIQLEGLTGGVSQANALIDDLRDKAVGAGVPFKDMLSFAKQLLPTLKGNTAQLDEWFGIVRRVATLNTTAMGGVDGATFSLREAFLSVQDGGNDFISLADRFNISKKALRDALKETGGDFLSAMDIVLNDMGIMNSTAERMGQTFGASLNVLRDAAVQLLAEGFTPLMHALTPLLQQTAAYLRTLRETNPGVATFAAGLIAATAAGAPLLLLLNQLIIAAKQLKALGVLGALGRGGIGAAAAVGGGFGGLGITRAIGRATGDDAMANRTWADIASTAQKLLFNIGFTLTRSTQLLLEAAAYVSNSWHTMIGSMLSTTAGFVRGLASLLPGGMGSGMGTAAAALEAGAGLQRARGQNDVNMAAAFTERTNQWLQNWARSIQGGGAVAGNAVAGGGSRFDPGGAATGPDPAIIAQWAANVERIEREAGQARLDATRDYEEQRSEAIADYERGILRDAEDFARSRARAAEQLNRQIADIEADAAKRVSEAEEDYSERTTELRDDTNERLAKLDADYQRDRERAAEDHRDRLLNAAGRLDAVAVREEQRRFARSQQDAAENYDEQRSETQRALDERLIEEQESYAERLQAARDADAERIQDLRDNLAESQRLEDEDRAISQARQAEDFARQQAQAATDHAERLAQISRQAAEERKQLDESFMAQLSAEGVHNEQYLALQAAKQKASLALFDQWWSDIEKRFAVQGPQAQMGPLPQASGWLTDFNGGRTQPAAAGFPTSFADAASRAAGRSVTFGAGAIVVNAAMGQSEEMVARLVREEMIALLEGAQ
jgi:hypothetical protein